MKQFTDKQIAAQKRFAEAVKKHGGRLPKGSKIGGTSAPKKAATKRRRTTKKAATKRRRTTKKAAAPKRKRTTKKKAAPKKKAESEAKLGHFESKGRKWSQARKDAGGAARFNAAGVRIGGGFYMSKALREHDVGELGPRLVNNSMVFDPKADRVAQLGVRDEGSATPHNDKVLAKYAK